MINRFFCSCIEFPVRQIRPVEQRKPYQKIDPDARDEGADYEGETRVVVLPDPVAIAAAKTAEEEAAAAAAHAQADAAAAAAKDKAKKGGKKDAKGAKDQQPEEHEEHKEAPPAPEPPKKSTDPEGIMTIHGFVYDVGTATCKMIKDLAASTDLLVVWGTAGVCESSAFQAGQKALVTAASKRKPPSAAEIAEQEAAANAAAAAAAAAKAETAKGKKGAAAAKDEAPPEIEKPTAGPGVDRMKFSAHSIIIGDSSVEWFTRLLDPDGDADGDLVGTGRVACTSRQSSLFAGLLGLYNSPILRNTLLRRRKPLESEWKYDQIKEERDEEEEEEDDDDDDEDEE